jgi:hypothetical protein
MPPISVRIILSQKCKPKPTCKNAATGGRQIARMIFKIVIVWPFKKVIMA